MSVLIPMKKDNETTDCPVHSFIAKNSYQCGEAECTCGGDVQAAHAAIPTRNYALDHRDECTRPKPESWMSSCWETTNCPVHQHGECTPPKLDMRKQSDREKAWIMKSCDRMHIDLIHRIDRGLEALQEAMETVLSDLRRAPSENQTEAAVQELLDALESVQAQRRG